jgi:hypothetical protein
LRDFSKQINKAERRKRGRIKFRAIIGILHILGLFGVWRESVEKFWWEIVLGYEERSGK